jgi:hypothetical protein
MSHPDRLTAVTAMACLIGFLRIAAVATLEHPALAARLGNIAGKPLELVGRALPEAASEAVATVTTKPAGLAVGPGPNMPCCCIDWARLCAPRRKERGLANRPHRPRCLLRADLPDRAGG